MIPLVSSIPDRTDIHYVKGQVLLRMGRKDEGRKELETSVRIDNERRADREKQVESGIVPSPELLQPDLSQPGLSQPDPAQSDPH